MKLKQQNHLAPIMENTIRYNLCMGLLSMSDLSFCVTLLVQYVLLPIGKYCSKLVINSKGYAADSLCYYREPGEVRLWNGSGTINLSKTPMPFQMWANVLLGCLECVVHAGYTCWPLYYRALSWQSEVSKRQWKVQFCGRYLGCTQHGRF